MDLLKPLEAARLAGVSYPTLKQWIYQGRIKSVKAAGGHHRIPKSEIERVTGAKRLRAKKKPVGLEAISGRNKLLGAVTEVRFDGLLAQFAVDIGGQEIISIITSDSARTLGLRKGNTVYALVKATEVMIIQG